MLRDEKIELGSAEDDLLGQLPAIETLVSTLGGLATPACIALYGAWGSGKTNIMHNAMKRCEAKLWIPVWFDPWEYDGQPELLTPLLRALLLAIRRIDGKSALRGRLRQSAFEALKSVGALAVRTGVRVGVNVAARQLGLDPGGSGPKGSDLVAAQESARMDVESWLKGDGEPLDEVAQVKARFAQLVHEALAVAAKGGAPPDDARVVFFLDDLDRCLPDRVVELIEKVKLLLCGSPDCRAMFVFALDRHVVGEAIRQRFPGSTQYTGENYLEKIFDFALEAPPIPLALPIAGDGPSPGLRRFVDEVAKGLPRTLDSICDPFGGRRLLFEVLSQPAFANPRVIKRTLNRLHLLTAVDDRRGLIESAKGNPTKKRYLTWVAGAERFRWFRHFLRNSGSELGYLARFITREPGVSLNPVLEARANDGGFRQYFGDLKIHSKDHTQNREEAAWTEYDPRLHEHTLRWFDDLMRSAGV